MPKRKGEELAIQPSHGAYYLGIDPGKTGGIAVLYQYERCTPVVHEAYKMPSTERDTWAALTSILSDTDPIVASIEKVGGYIGQGQPGSAMFNFGMGYGGLRMALVAAGIPFEEVIPRTWQKAFSISPRGKTESKSKFKNRLKAKAQQLFPISPVTLATCDALLIAEFCRRKHQGLL